MGTPIERELPKKEAINRFKSKLKALEKYKGSLIAEGSFIGVKDEKGEWIVTNTMSKEEIDKKLKEVL